MERDPKRQSKIVYTLGWTCVCLCAVGGTFVAGAYSLAHPGSITQMLFNPGAGAPPILFAPGLASTLFLIGIAFIVLGLLAGFVARRQAPR